MKDPMFSVVTVCWNSEASLLSAIESVNFQSYPLIEHIIVDGGSSDGTLEIAQRTAKRSPNIRSEPDTGIYNAMNNGLQRCSGDYVLFLNSDDKFASETILETAANAIRRGAHAILAPINYGTVVKPIIWRPTLPSFTKLRKGWHCPHPGFIVSNEVVEQIGFFDEALDISSDFDFMLRAILHCMNNDLAIECLQETMTEMSPHGESSSFKASIIGNRNVLRSLRKNGISVNSVAYLLRRLTPKVRRKLITHFRLNSDHSVTSE